MFKGTLRKLKSSHHDIIKYQLPLASIEKSTDLELIDLNDLIEKNIKINFTGNIFCIDSGRKIKRSFHQGYSWESFITLPECDTCLFKPELCHYQNGTCRDASWGEQNCLQPHIIYLAISSALKVGITRKKNIPSRWIDQGAVEALAILEVDQRKASGLIEVEIAKELADKTNWRNMLKNDIQHQDLIKVRDEIFKKYAKVIQDNKAIMLDEKPLKLNYPVRQYPTKVSSLNLDKKSKIEGKLMGVKGQYLIFEHGVINIRRHQGYEVEIII